MGSSHILVVEDDPVVAEMLTDVLQAQGYTVQVCKDGKAALYDLVHGRFGLMILDVLLPHVSGFAVVEQLRAQPQWKSFPIIMMSGMYRSRNHRRHMMHVFKVVDYLDKPLEVSRLLELCQTTLGKPSSAPRVNPIDALPTVLIEAAEFSGAATQTVQLPAIESLAANMIDAETSLELRQVEADARRKFRPSAFLMQGQLKGQGVAPLLGKLWHAEATGALLLRRGDVKKIVYLRDGSPFTVQSNLVSECLGQILMHAGLISRDACERSIERMQATGRRQGEILVEEMGCVTEENLQFGLEVQIETKLYSTFSWDTGAYRFNPSAPMPEVTTKLIRRCPELIVEGIRRTLSETFMRSRVLPAMDVPLRWRTRHFNVASLNLAPHEEVALREAPMPQTSRELLESMPLPPAETLRLIYTLIALEIWVPAAPR